MTEYTMSRFIVALLLVGMFASIFSLFFYFGSAEYGAGYDNQTLAKYNQTEAIVSLVDNSSTEVKTDPNLADILGAMFQQGYSTARNTYISMNLFVSMANDAKTGSEAGTAMDIIIYYLIAIVTALIVIGILLRWVIKDKT